MNIIYTLYCRNCKNTQLVQ